MLMRCPRRPKIIWEKCDARCKILDARKTTIIVKGLCAQNLKDGKCTKGNNNDASGVDVTLGCAVREAAQIRLGEEEENWSMMSEDWHKHMSDKTVGPELRN